MTTVFDRVNAWAQLNASDDYYYGTRFSYWRSALAAGICTEDEYNNAKKHYANLWDYRGD